MPLDASTIYCHHGIPPGGRCARCLERDLDDARATIATLTAHVAGLETDADVLMGEVKRLTAERDEWQLSCVAARRVNVELITERDTLRAKVADLEQDLEDCRNGLANAH